jgi:hypothetical protein
MRNTSHFVVREELSLFLGCVYSYTIAKILVAHQSSELILIGPSALSLRLNGAYFHASDVAIFRNVW